MKSKERRITLTEFKSLRTKMKLYNLKEGYIGELGKGMTLFISECERAKAKITLNDIEDAIQTLESKELEVYDK
tara:strand:- start:7791 stop:8012 length:222 start_codon:yes stop_codon:yes gene_type:complete